VIEDNTFIENAVISVVEIVDQNAVIVLRQHNNIRNKHIVHRAPVKGSSVAKGPWPWPPLSSRESHIKGKSTKKAKKFLLARLAGWTSIVSN